MSIYERQLKLGVNKLAGWADTNSFKMHPEKSTCDVWTRVRCIHLDPDTTINGAPIPVQKEHKF